VTPHLELAYLAVEVPDPDGLAAFFTDVIGLAPGHAIGDTRTFRNDDRAQRILVSPGDATDATAIGIQVPDDAFDDALARLAAAGATPVVEPDDTVLAARRVERLARVRAPWGVDVEIVTRLAAAATPLDAPLVPGGFLTGDLGFGHSVFATTAFDESVRFALDALGLARSDRLSMPIAENLNLDVTFFHANERHHSLALAHAPFDLPQVLHHVMVETNERDDVGAAFDRAWASGLPIANGLGRHDNDGMFSFYVQSPAGFLVEVGHGARRITDDWDDSIVYDRISRWGHQPLVRP
jgi:2,3-dihydroxybiphenyl 1,2-dioxygenase